MSDIKELIFSSKIIFWDFDGVIKKSNQVKNDAFFNLFEDIKKEQREQQLFIRNANLTKSTCKTKTMKQAKTKSH